jgi:DNA replication protein DnaC
MLLRTNMPSLYYGTQFSKIPNSCPHRETVKAFLGGLARHIDAGRGLYLWGDYSVGKSAIAAIILKRGLQLKQIGYWCRCSNICSDVVEGRPFDSTMSVEDRILSVPLLVMDELLCHDDRRDAYTENVVRERVVEGLSTIITSNYSPPKLKNKYPALAEVLKEFCVPVQVKGHDFRSEIADEYRKEVR